MSPLVELSRAVRCRRSEIGLTQARVAQISRLSRATINQIENGTIKDLSLVRTMRLLEALGLSFSVGPPPGPQRLGRKTPASVLAARSASVSHRDLLSPEVLKDALLTGGVPSEFTPHLNTLLEDASVSMLASLADELSAEHGLERP